MTVGLVLSGGGTRGAYEAGALSVLVPELERLGQRPTVVTGTSAGSLNAAFVASVAHLPADDAVTRARELWTSVRYRDALEPILPGGAGRALEYLGEALGIPRSRLWSLLDPSPLRRTLLERIDFAQIASNLDAGRLDAAAVVATSARTGRTVVFHAGGDPPDHDDWRGIDYVATPLAVEHVLASSAIPTVFPAVAVDGGWYVDGGTRANTPVRPALALGAERLVVIALNSVAPGDAGPGRPDALAGAGLLLGGLLGDQVLHDVRTLCSTNAISRVQVPFILIAPRTSTTIGAIARRVFDKYYADLLDSVRHADVATLGRAVAGTLDDLHGELLSYLFVAPEFTSAIFDLGAEDARAWLKVPHDDGIWQVSPPARA